MAIKDMKGKDRVIGRPIRVNKCKLIPNSKGYAEVMFLGDVHLGHSACDMDRVKRQVNYCLENHVYVQGMGDFLEAGLKGSVGASVYEQKMNPDSQVVALENLFQPLVDAGLILGLHMGNHEGRIWKETSVNVIRWLCRNWKVPYLGDACWSAWTVGKQTYTVYSLHGRTGSRFPHTKLKAVYDIAHNFNCNIVAMGHTHDVLNGWTLMENYDKRSRTIKQQKKLILVTGHYIQYDDSYPQAFGMPIGKMGSPKVKLFADKFDIHESS